ncbi:uroporphyrinogen-III C-methyltransferase [Paenibacillus periandrae]|uniref:uroporphyrinogen-III C-methyltransferase n=1 Tax=Paenibacillus periandrae TaxID=1761741 RepID=UPI001F09B84B|nr:uroporphyrinogen-III C-methyltransferase [Paenibacillus periandrae]
MKTGTVHIVGAGPGDPELITVKALRLIKEADVILYDRLVNEQLLAEAKPDGQLVYCGKSPGAHTMSQEQIHRKLVEYAMQGKNVVRLKGGDPFIFGRGGEEALALAERGIPYEVVPGITSALGAASAADIPLTHRGMSASVAFVTGSRCSSPETRIRWDLLAHSVDMLVIYMGITHLERIRTELLMHGKDADTPTAIVENGSTDQQRTVTGTLGLIHKQAAAMKIKNPALIIIGASVKVREQLNLLVMDAIHQVG